VEKRLADEKVARTGFSLVQPVTAGEHQGRICSEFSDEHRERTAGDVGLVELDMHVVDAVFARHETHRVPIVVHFSHEDVVLGAGRRVDVSLDLALGSVHLQVERRRLTHLRTMVQSLPSADVPRLHHRHHLFAQYKYKYKYKYVKSLYFTVIRFLMKSFKSANTDVINDCLLHFKFSLPIVNWFKKERRNL